MISLTRQSIKRIIKILIFSFAIILVAGYAFFATHNFLSGPYLEITEPQNGSVFTNPQINIKGVAKRINEITINDRPITIDEEGNWNESEVLFPGYNPLLIHIKDRFGREKTYRLELVYDVD